MNFMSMETCIDFSSISEGKYFCTNFMGQILVRNSCLWNCSLTVVDDSTLKRCLVIMIIVAV